MIFPGYLDHTRDVIALRELEPGDCPWLAVVALHLVEVLEGQAVGVAGVMDEDGVAELISRWGRAGGAWEGCRWRPGRAAQDAEQNCCEGTQ